MSFHKGPMYPNEGSKCPNEGQKCLLQIGLKGPIGAEVVGAEVVGAEVVGTEDSKILSTEVRFDVVPHNFELLLIFIKVHQPSLVVIFLYAHRNPLRNNISCDRMQ